jgi:hypothetical protein
MSYPKTWKKLNIDFQQLLYDYFSYKIKKVD